TENLLTLTFLDVEWERIAGRIHLFFQVALHARIGPHVILFQLSPTVWAFPAVFVSARLATVATKLFRCHLSTSPFLAE
ncbi:hypothetical protein ACFUCH_35575, partial [Streptomyces olivaceus]|uniref:hypothetical protein n=1 Tax=Streptomyces olivaceus TaxID=47716 RepID=UPI0036298D78